MTIWLTFLSFPSLAKVVKLEIQSHMKDEEINMLEEELKMKVQCRDLTILKLEDTCENNVLQGSFQEDQIESLKAEILKIRAESDRREEEQRHAVAEMKTQMELSCLEKFSDILG